MSFVKKRPKGYYGVAEYRDSNGKRHQKGAGTFKLKRETLAAADKLERELNGLNTELANLSFAEYYQRWYRLYKEHSVEPITQVRYRTVGKLIADFFGQKKIAEIHRSDYQEFINWYGHDKVKDTVIKVNSAVKLCVNLAIDDDLIIKDFTHNVQITHDKQRRPKIEYLNEKEIRQLESATASKLDHNNTSRYMILTAILTGMRKSEIQALTWKDIDSLHATISITKSWDEQKKTFKPTKTESSIRTIKVNRQLLDWLEDLKVNGSTLIFMNKLGTIPTSTALIKVLRTIMTDCGISKQGFHFHSLRHVHVAYLLGQGVDVYAISKRLGHSDITITLKTYSYLIDEYKAKNDELITQKLAQLL